MTYKTTVEGEDHVCDAVQQYAEKYAAESVATSYNNGRAEGSVNSLAPLIISGNISLQLAIENSGLSQDEFLSIASRLGYKL